MVVKTQSIRGMSDILPADSIYWGWVEDQCRQVAKKYHYQEIRFPIVESTALFQRTIGESTDIVEKEMYTFQDRNGDSLTLRPEGTAGCMRAGLQNGIFHNQVQRLWYLGPMFRHERPQKGRYRQFHQFGVETVGMKGPDIDAELLMMVWRLWKELGIQEHLKLQLNSIGTHECRKNYNLKLVEFYQQNFDLLDEDSKRRLSKNPLRILDSKNPQIIELNQRAPIIIDHLDPPSEYHFKGLLDLLKKAEVPFELNPKLVRGLDYYNHMVFEWVSTELGSQGTVCAGGRYDGLSEQIGGAVLPAAGFAIGLERLITLIASIKSCSFQPDLIFILIGDKAKTVGLLLAEKIRNQFPQLSVETQLSEGGIKTQLKRADKVGAMKAIIIGEDEVKNKVVTIKELRISGEQRTISQDNLIEVLGGE